VISTLATNYGPAVPLVAGIWAVLNSALFLILFRVILPTSAQKRLSKGALWSPLIFVGFAVGWFPLLDFLDLVSPFTMIPGWAMGGSLALAIFWSRVTHDRAAFVWPLAAGAVATITCGLFTAMHSPLPAVFVPALLWHLIIGDLLVRLRRAFAVGESNARSCPQCHYDCRGLPGTLCPECGTNLATDASSPHVQ
jgi:hypothetical protein